MKSVVPAAVVGLTCMGDRDGWLLGDEPPPALVGQRVESADNCKSIAKRLYFAQSANLSCLAQTVHAMAHCLNETIRVLLMLCN